MWGCFLTFFTVCALRTGKVLFHSRILCSADNNEEGLWFTDVEDVPALQTRTHISFAHNALVLGDFACVTVCPTTND